MVFKFSLHVGIKYIFLSKFIWNKSKYFWVWVFLPVSVSEQPYLTHKVMWKSYENQQHSLLTVVLCTNVENTQSHHSIKGTAKSQMTKHIYVVSWHLFIWPRILLVKPVAAAWSFCGSCKVKAASTLGPWQKKIHVTCCLTLLDNEIPRNWLLSSAFTRKYSIS